MKKIDTSHIRCTEDKKKGRRFSKQEVIKILHENLLPVINTPYDKIVDGSKYTRLARDYNYENYRLCSYMDIKNLGLEDSFTGYQKQFFCDAGACIAIFNEIGGKLISIVFRAIGEKAFMDYSLAYSVYGYDMIDPEFKYGDYLILTEGIYDADSLRRLYPNTMAMLTSNITLMQSEILKTITDKFIIAFDSDDAGDKGFTVAIRRLGTDIKKLKVYPGDKDVGVMEEKRNINPTGIEFRERDEYYREEIIDCMSNEGFSL